MGQGFSTEVSNLLGEAFVPPELYITLFIDNVKQEPIIIIASKILEANLTSRERIQQIIKPHTVEGDFVVILARKTENFQIIFLGAYSDRDVQGYFPHETILTGKDLYMWIRTGQDITDRYYCSIECIKNLEEDSKKDMTNLLSQGNTTNSLQPQPKTYYF